MTKGNEMQTLSYNFLLDALMSSGVQTDGNDWSDCISTDYSGRSMYGKECFGITLESDKDFTLVMLELFRFMEEEGNGDVVRELVDSMRSDNMGLSYIYYFPNWELEDLPPGFGDNEEEDDDDE